MNKYSTAIEVAKIGEQGFAISPGWVTVYRTDPETREFTGVSQEYLSAGVGISAGSYPDAPVIPEDGQLAVCRTADGKAWETVPDLRGQTAYDKQTRRVVSVGFPGALPEGLTLEVPRTEFDVWNGERWVTDVDALHSAEVTAAQTELNARVREAETAISQLERAIKLDMLTGAEKAELSEWEKYSVLLSRIHPEDAPNIDWPRKPGS
ncbi:TPA: tail fiber assembly protein [Klebsiella pneumoniae]|nr:tail fiber assembly protein [Klebsiella pneumoniae]HCB0080081.1 tail fiber assembly protein [Klebsiella pneumoniae]HEB5772902.1 tail fiber assembly protein [Klebsiella pneumoniae]HEB9059499.1 tail fiber assembly protein [Klebsiella pneumoniae]HEB9065120.1 tail fiber assembly protein [Klebsiella pneumoniae]